MSYVNQEVTLLKNETPLKSGKTELGIEGCKCIIHFICLEAISIGCIIYNAFIGATIILAFSCTLSGIFCMEKYRIQRSGLEVLQSRPVE
jgi:hypothetical protein